MSVIRPFNLNQFYQFWRVSAILCGRMLLQQGTYGPISNLILQLTILRHVFLLFLSNSCLLLSQKHIAINWQKYASSLKKYFAIWRFISNWKVIFLIIRFQYSNMPRCTTSGANRQFVLIFLESLRGRKTKLTLYTIFICLWRSCRCFKNQYL